MICNGHLQWYNNSDYHSLCIVQERCSVTAYGTNRWWAVDLEKTDQVIAVEITASIRHCKF